LSTVFCRNLHDAGQNEIHHADVFGVAAARGFETGGDAGALVGFALGEGAVATEMAFQARDVMVQGNAVADLETARGESLRTATSPTRADFDDGTGGFVAEDAGRRHGAELDFFDVGWADAADGDFDEQFMGADARDRDGLEAQVVHAAIDDGAHGFGNVRHGKVLATKRTKGTKFSTTA
jgi:hypothetical protein